MTESLLVKLFWQKRLFLPGIPKKNHFAQNTQLWVGFAKIKSFHSQNTQFWAVFEKKNGRHWEQNKKFKIAFLKRLCHHF